MKHSTLPSLFTDIANAIRSKTGSTDNIVADDFPDAIVSIPTGTRAEGTATADKVLSGYTFSNDDAVGIAGTMQNIGHVSEILSPYRPWLGLDEGYYEGGEVFINGDYKSVTPNLETQNIEPENTDVYLVSL